MMRWREEIEELHQVFETYFRGTSDSLERVDAVLGADFTIVGPDGVESNRAETMRALRGGHGHADSLAITTTEHRLLSSSLEVVMAAYVENHTLASGSNHRLTTVVFDVDAAAPNGLVWRRVHETWLPETMHRQLA